MQSTNRSTHDDKDYPLTGRHDLLVRCKKPQAACRYSERVWHLSRIDLTITYAPFLFDEARAPTAC